ncbi:MAG: DUF4166 domain-containing protein [Aureispira sp.]|nr:DUF4166 domain-containing protein [Aureispira sp.]
MGKDKIIIAPIFEKMHSESEPVHATGTFQSKKGKGFLNHIFWMFIQIPISEVKKKFELEIAAEKESKVWIRKFGLKEFSTRANTYGQKFIEKQGVFEFVFLLKVFDQKLIYDFQQFKIFKIPMPKFLSIQPIATCEQVDQNKWTFDVEIKSPFGKPIIEYWGEAEILPIKK